MEDEKKAKRIAKARQRGRDKNYHKRRRTLIIALIVAAVLAAPIKNIVSLQIEHHRLKKQNQELSAQEKKLQKTLKDVNSDEYISDEARKQLRLVNPDEILFVFPKDDGSKDDKDKTKDDSSQKDDGSKDDKTNG